MTERMNSKLLGLRMILAAALFANAVDLKSVTGRQVAMLSPDLLRQFADFLGEEFHRTAAIGAHHVMVTAAVVLMFVTGDAVVKGNFARQSAFREQFQRSINRGVTDAGVFLLHQAMQFVGGQVIAGFKKGAKDCVALGGLLEAHAFEMPVQNLLGLANHLAGETGLVIDTLL